MEGITKEYFDGQLSKLATKEDLAAQTTELKAYTDTKIEELAVMVQEGFAEVYRRLDLRDQVEKHEHDIQELKRALNLA